MVRASPGPSWNRHIPELFSSFVDMKEQFVYDPLISKRQQYLLATQVCISTGLRVSS